ncbi:MAG: mannonate dehydratase [Pseudomonadota bacterium]
MLQTWRWFGPDDPVSLGDARQAGVEGIVTALHDQYDGRAWSAEAIAARVEVLAAAGFGWSVCESIPVADAIKVRGPERRRLVDAWKDTLARLGAAGVPVVCYNFMPVVDWTRTDLRHPTDNGGLALRFDMAAFVAYDVFVLARAGATDDYDPAILARADALYREMSLEAVETLERTVIAGLPGGEDSYAREEIRARIAEFEGCDSADLRTSLLEFLAEVVPVAEEVGVRLAIHPDDPPFSLFGLPRIVSRATDLAAIVDGVPSPANGLTLCAGSLGARTDNDVVAIAERFAKHIHFAHLRNVTCDPDGSFMEAEHLDGRTDMARLCAVLLAEERRRAEREPGYVLPMRPDHGHVLLDDIGKDVNPGYSCLGRMKGLAELRGVIRTLESGAVIGS